MNKTKLQWHVPDYYPLKQALLKSGSAYDNITPEGNTVTISNGVQYTLGGNQSSNCGIINTFYTTAIGGSFVPLAGDLLSLIHI